MANKFQVMALKKEHPDWHTRKIAEHLGCNPGYVRATLARAAGYRPPEKRIKAIITAEEFAERQLDHRDLDILYDIGEGHTETQVAEHWDVTHDHVKTLKRRSREAK